MPAPYSSDLRQRAIESYKNGEGSQEAIAKRFKLSLSSFKRYWKRYQEIGKVDAFIGNKGRKPTVSGEKLITRLKAILKKYPDATLSELCHHYNKSCPKKLGIIVMWRTLKRLGVKRKKKSHYAVEQDRPDIQAKRKKFKKKYRQ